MKPLTQGVDLHATFHHEGPRNKTALWNGPRAMALVGAHVSQGSAQLQAPGNGTPVVAHVTGILRIFHGGQVLLHHVGIAAKSVACQYDGVTMQEAGEAIRLQITEAVDAARVIGMQGSDLCLR